MIHCNMRGFTLVEVLLASVLAAALVIGCTSFLQVQLHSGVVLNERDRIADEFESAFNRMAQSVERLQLPFGHSEIEVSDSGVVVRYHAGEYTRNCHGTLVQPGAFVVDLFELNQHVLSCQSDYFDINGVKKQDQQPFLNNVKAFHVKTIAVFNTVCIDAVEFFIALETRFIGTVEESYRLMFPSCDLMVQRVNAYSAGRLRDKGREVI